MKTKGLLFALCFIIPLSWSANAQAIPFLDGFFEKSVNGVFNAVSGLFNDIKENGISSAVKSITNAITGGFIKDYKDLKALLLTEWVNFRGFCS